MNKKRFFRSFLGIAVVSTLFVFVVARADVSGSKLPVSDGNYSQWTPKTGTSHFALVDETVCNGNTDYNVTSTVGNRDSYSISISGIPTGAKITQIDITPCASRNANGSTNPVMNVFYRFNGTNSADAGSYSLTGTTPVALATTSYSSLSIFKGPSSSLEIGAVLTSGTKGARLSRIQAFVTYTTLNAPTSLVATPSISTAGKIALTWTDNATIEDSYVVERSVDNTNWTQIATTSVNAVSYDDTGLSLGTTYYHRVRAYNAGGYSSYSNTASSTTENAPLAPSGLSANQSGSNINLAWTDNSANEINFKIERGTDGVNFAHIATTTLNAISYLDTSVVGGTTYYYRVSAYRSIGYSTYSNTASETALATPVAPSSANATALSTVVQIDITWNDNSSNEDNFEIERSTNGVNYVNIATTSAGTISYSDTSIAEATLYYYRVRASNVVGYSAYSNISSATSGATPLDPSGLTATPSTSTISITLNWTDNSSNEDNFILQRSFDGVNGWIGVATTSANTVTYMSTGLSQNTTYYYRVKAINGIGSSNYSANASATTASSPSAPTSLSSFLSGTDISLSWNDTSSNEDGFRIERKINGGIFSQIATGTTNSVSFLDTGLTASTTYVYRIRAYNVIGNSTYSNLSTTTTNP